MRSLILSISFFLWTTYSFAQNQGNQDSTATRLISSIANANNVEYKYIGCFGETSLLCKQVDSLKKIIGLDSFIGLFNHHSAVLKYYSFVALLDSDTDSALVVLKSFNDTSTRVSKRSDQWFYAEPKLIALMTAEFLGIAKIKYYYGRGRTFKFRAIPSQPKNKKKWRRIETEINEIIEENSLSRTWIEDYIN